jgi:hypothetical protein
MKLLTHNPELCSVSFYREAKYIEFTQVIDDVDISVCVNTRQRDKLLREKGKNYFKKYFPKINFEIFKTYEHNIDELENWASWLWFRDESINNKIRIFFKRYHYKLEHLCDWKILVKYKDMEYTFYFLKRKILPKLVIEKRKYEYTEPKESELTQEEIEHLLAGIDSVGEDEK